MGKSISATKEVPAHCSKRSWQKDFHDQKGKIKVHSGYLWENMPVYHVSLPLFYFFNLIYSTSKLTLQSIA
jgi:hypothetical protein